MGQSGRAGWWRVCYQLGLPRLVSTYLLKFWFLPKYFHNCITITSFHTNTIVTSASIIGKVTTIPTFAFT